MLEVLYLRRRYGNGCPRGYTHGGLVVGGGVAGVEIARRGSQEGYQDTLIESRSRLFTGQSSRLGKQEVGIRMNATGTYEEKLPCGGTLQVENTSWNIQYYFSGPDLRYNGTFITVQGTEVPKYIKAFEANWKEFQRLKTSVPKGGEFSTSGKAGMTIRVGKWDEGVCLQSYHMPINTQAQLDRVIQSYQYALRRAPQIIEFLTKL